MSSNYIKQSAAGIFVSLGFQFFTSAIHGAGDKRKISHPSIKISKTPIQKPSQLPKRRQFLFSTGRETKETPLRQPLEDMATTQITGLGWKVIGRELTTKALREYPDPLKAEV